MKIFVEVKSLDVGDQYVTNLKVHAEMSAEAPT
jgi:hypothetical protein